MGCSVRGSGATPHVHYSLIPADGIGKLVEFRGGQNDGRDVRGVGGRSDNHHGDRFPEARFELGAQGFQCGGALQLAHPPFGEYLARRVQQRHRERHCADLMSGAAEAGIVRTYAEFHLAHGFVVESLFFAYALDGL